MTKSLEGRVGRPRKSKHKVKKLYAAVITNDLTWPERLQMKKYAMKHDYFPDRNYKYMTLTDFVKEFLRRERGEPLDEI